MLLPFSAGSVNTLTNGAREDTTPILMKKKSHSAPESDSSSSIIYDATPVPKKKLSLDETTMKPDVAGSSIKEFLKERNQKLQEKDLDETSDSQSTGSRLKAISPAATLTSVSDTL